MVIKLEDVDRISLRNHVIIESGFIKLNKNSMATASSLLENCKLKFDAITAYYEENKTKLETITDLEDVLLVRTSAKMSLLKKDLYQTKKLLDEIIVAWDA